MKRHVRIDIGRSWLRADEAARLSPGSELLLDVTCGADAEVYADGVRVARGDLAAVDGTYAVRVTEILRAPAGAVTEESR